MEALYCHSARLRGTKSLHAISKGHGASQGLTCMSGGTLNQEMMFSLVLTGFCMCQKARAGSATAIKLCRYAKVTTAVQRAVYGCCQLDALQ